MTLQATQSRFKMKFRSQRGFSLVEAMVAIAILAVGLLGVGYSLHVASQVNLESIQILHRSPDAQGKIGLRDSFNSLQATVYGNLK